MILLCFFVELNEVHSVTQIYKSIGEFLKGVRPEQTNGASAVSGTLFFLEETVIWTIVAYVVGHIVAYLSSVTVEKFAIWTYGYPSEFLLGPVPSLHYWKVNECCDGIQPTCWKEFIEFAWRIFIGLFLLPISLCSLVFGKVLGMKSFFVKPLDKTLRETIDANKNKLAESLHITIHEGDDFHRVIYHYEYERQPNHVQKMDNYVALYGFLRAMTFIADCATLWIVIRYVLPDFSSIAEIDWHLVLMVAMCIAITYTFFMAFMKFYRRFTLESFMCLVIDPSFKETRTIPYNYVPTEGMQEPTAPLSITPSSTQTLTNGPVS